MTNACSIINHKQRIWGYSSLTLLSLLGLMFICPVVVSPSSALNGSDYNKPAWQPSEPSAVSLSLEEMPEMKIVPRIGGEVGVSSARLSVSTSSNAGYKLYVNTKDRTNAMVNVYDQSSASIAAFSTPTAASGFKPNTWGYALTDSIVDSNTIYQPMPVASSLAYDTKALTGEHYLSFAASIDTSLPAGQYSNTVAISAIANPAVITGMMELTYMQDMTSSICKDTVGWNQNYNKDSSGSYIITPGNEVTKQLIDIRDGKEYWVAKLADGNCWMTQNLALDLKADKVLTDTDTDLNSKTSWRVIAGTETEAPGVQTAPSDTMRSWNLGEYVLADPLTGDSGCVGLASLADCKRLQSVQGWEATFVAQPGVWEGKDTTQIYVDNAEVTVPLLVAVNSEQQVYDAHYLLGNYYQWSTATAASGTNAVISPESSKSNAEALTDVSDSICPKGWQLPVSGGNYLSTSAQYGNPFDREKSFYRLILAYGYPDATQYIVNRNGNGFTPFLNEDFAEKMNNPQASQYPIKSPLYLMRAGFVPLFMNGNSALANGGLSYVGGYVEYLSSTAHIHKDFAWGFYGYVSAAIPADSIYRFDGHTVRCVAR